MVLLLLSGGQQQTRLRVLCEGRIELNGRR
jgi:hypothetical protein